MTDPYCTPNDPLRASVFLFFPLWADYPLVLCCQNHGTPSKVEGELGWCRKSGYEQFTIGTGIQVYFAYPGSPWERGTNENTNGLIRQYFSKGTDFTQVSKEKILDVQRKLNDRSRRALGYLKPDEVINQLVTLKT